MISMLFVVSIILSYCHQADDMFCIAIPINETVDIKLSVNGACLE